MAKISGCEILSRALRDQGCTTIFYLIAGPMGEATTSCHEAGMHMIDVRHEQAAGFMAHGFSRIALKPGVVITGSGPGTVNGFTGLVNAFMDCVPLVLIGGSSPSDARDHGAFQELDQMAMARPFTKWSGQVTDVRQIPSMVQVAFRHATSGRPGPVYLDCPGDIINSRVEEEQVSWETSHRISSATYGDPTYVARAVELLEAARKPILVGGSGLLWARAAKPFKELIEALNVPFYTTPQARGLVPDDHPLSFPEARSTAFREADVVLVLGTRDNYVMGHLRPPRFSPQAKLISVNIERNDIARVTPVEIGIVGDAGAVLSQIKAEFDRKGSRPNTAEWIERLSGYCRGRRVKNEESMSVDSTPIHPLRLCKEVRDFMDRSAILSVDGQEILNFARQSIPIYAPHSLTSGTAGWMGVGVPLGIGGKAAKPEEQSIVLTGDGAFGLNGLEVDTAIRHKLPVIIVVSNNGGWTGKREGQRRVGRDLGFPDYEKIAHAFGGHGERIERPEDLRPALERAKASGTASIINVVTDPAASATTAKFTSYDYA
ncbi:MAG: thiamine pyrophosphate-binding protein [Chloroflexi bacterium]|nr:thiamine pyrophosphate-binding protein [Chloroflexota bacterium]